MSLHSNEPVDDFFLRTAQVIAQTGMSRTTLHRLVKAGDFPAPKRLGVRAVGWLSSDIARWRQDRPSARTESQAA
jgi:prophage regulatory protein